MDYRHKSQLNLFVALENDARVSQAKLSKRLGIAAGLVNILMKRAVKQGLIKMTEIPAHRYAYYLTPKGFAEKTKLVSKYLDTSLTTYRRLRVEYRDIFTDLETRGIRSVTLVGDIDIAELAIMASFDTAINITALINAETKRSNLGPVPVKTEIDETFNGVMVICDARSPQECYEKIIACVDRENVYFPKTFCISEPSVQPQSEPQA